MARRGAKMSAVQLKAELKAPVATAVDVTQLAVAAKEEGVAEVLRLLAAPEDLVRLSALRAEYQQRLASNKAHLSNTVQSQLEAARSGTELLSHGQRSVVKLRADLDRMHRRAPTLGGPMGGSRREQGVCVATAPAQRAACARRCHPTLSSTAPTPFSSRLIPRTPRTPPPRSICRECATLIDNSDVIRELSLAARNMAAVLDELADIVDLPQRAAAVEAMLGDDRCLVKAFEELALLEGIVAAARAAWQQGTGRREAEMQDLSRRLSRVGEVSAKLEAKLWGLVAGYQALAQRDPQLLVDVLRVVELQEALDAAGAKRKLAAVKRKHFRDKLFLELEGTLDGRFQPLLDAADACAVPNASNKFDQHGNRVTKEERDYLGNLTAVTRVDAAGKEVPCVGACVGKVPQPITMTVCRSLLPLADRRSAAV